MERLDRALANSDWCSLFPQASISHLPPTGSDHCPILLSTHPKSYSQPMPFKFFNTWLSESSCIDVIKDAWLTPVNGSPAFQVVSKLNNVRDSVKVWNRDVFGNVQKNIKSELRIICNLHSSPQSCSVVDRLTNHTSKLEQLYLYEEGTLSTSMLFPPKEEGVTALMAFSVNWVLG
ncbi:hypothetical protein BVC80_1307g4 [Macleaya cordata]|uniref:Endonuclease/exonuclease/phosphatase n=1 Tax=Macleaya cordata TaxID=56857 RepID=A0A200R378_MACCD|nr:hypothetical protein BVC80_1307g4 [Macleaya cordata]